MEITQERVKELFDYHPDGHLIRKCNSGRAKAGNIVGSTSSNGYVFIRINQKACMAHRLIFLWHYGRFPVADLDHIDRNRRNNKIENLREATRSQNNGNSRIPNHNTSGYKGVQWCARTGKWRAIIYMNNKRKCLGRYKNIEDAAMAYHNAAVSYFGEFAKTAFVQPTEML